MKVQNPFIDWDKKISTTIYIYKTRIVTTRLFILGICESFHDTLFVLQYPVTRKITTHLLNYFTWFTRLLIFMVHGIDYSLLGLRYLTGVLVRRRRKACVIIMIKKYFLKFNGVCLDQEYSDF